MASTSTRQSKRLKKDSTHYGQRLLPHVVSELASAHPDGAWFSIPRSPDVSDGFVDVTYRQLANAVDYMAWWLDERLGQSKESETLAYLGPIDTRYPILTIAAMKVGYKLLLLSPRNSDEGQYAVMRATECHRFLCASTEERRVSELMAHFEGAAKERSVLAVPEQQDVLSKPNRPYPYNATYEEERYKSWLVLHTSGTTTGKPKPIFITNGYYAYEDVLRFFSDVDGRRLINEIFQEGSRYLHAMPLFHVGGVIFGLLKSLFMQHTVVLPPPDVPITPELVTAALQYGNCDGSNVAPSMIDTLSAAQDFLRTWETQKYMVIGSSPLSKAAGDRLQSRKPLGRHLFGSTEIGILPCVELEDSVHDWQYHHFHPWSGACLQSVGHSDLYELVIQRVDEHGLPGKQPCFELYPDIQEYRTADLFSRHPTKPYLWKFEGRNDDILILSNGEQLNPTTMEGLIAGSHPEITGALIVGQGKSQPGLLLELRHSPETTSIGRTKALDDVWPVVGRANKVAPAYGQLVKPLVAFTGPEKPFARTPKLSVSRMKTVETFHDVIEAIYADYESGAGHADASGKHRLENPQSVASIQSFLKHVHKKALQLNEDLHHETNLFSKGLDSLKGVEVVRSINRALKELSNGDAHPIPMRLLYENPTVDGLARALHSHVNHKPHGVAKKEQWPRQCSAMIERYTKDLCVPVQVGSDDGGSGHTVMITGTTGSLGSHLLEALLQSSQYSKIYCLNRSADARQNYLSTFSFHSVPDDDVLDQRVEFLQTADISSPNFGLDSEEIYVRLRDSVSLIIHNAWPIHFHLCLEQGMAPHIAGVRSLVDFAAAAKRCPRIAFISSLSAVTRFKQRESKEKHGSIVIPERVVYDPTAADPLDYSQSKYIAERVLDAAGQVWKKKKAGRAFPAPLILRIGQIAGPIGEVGDKWKENEIIPSLFKSSSTLKALPAYLGEKNRLRWVPVDVCAKAILEATATAPHTADDGAVVNNIVNPREVSWSKSIMPIVKAYMEKHSGETVEVLSLEEWIRRVDSFGEIPRPQADKIADTANPAIKLLDFYKTMVGSSEDEGLGAPIAIGKALDASESLRSLQPVNEQWMERWMRDWGL